MMPPGVFFVVLQTISKFYSEAISFYISLMMSDGGITTNLSLPSLYILTQGDY